MSSEWGWVNQLPLGAVPEPARRRLEYLTSLTVLHQLSVKRAKDLWSEIQATQSTVARRRLREDMSAMHGPPSSLTTTLLESVFVLTATASGAWFIGAIGAGVWTTVVLTRARRKALRETLRPGETAAALGRRRLAEVEHYAQRLVKEDASYVGWLRPLKAPAKKVGEVSLSNLFAHFLDDAPAQVQDSDAPKEMDAGNYWLRLKQMGDRSEDLLTSLVKELNADLQSATSEEEREALAEALLPRPDDPGLLTAPPGLPGLSATVKEMQKLAAGQLKDDQRQLSNRTRLEDLAYERLGHPWLLVFFAIYLPAPAIVDREYYETPPRTSVPVQKHGGRRVPYFVDGEWFPVRTEWAGEEQIALAEAIMLKVRMPPTYRTTYWDEATSRVTVPSRRGTFVPGPAVNISRYPPFESYAPATVPKLRDATRDFGFVLLADTLIELQIELKVTPLVRDLLKDVALWAANTQDWALMRNACTRDGGAKLRELGFGRSN